MFWLPVFWRLEISGKSVHTFPLNSHFLIPCFLPSIPGTFTLSWESIDVFRWDEGRTLPAEGWGLAWDVWLLLSVPLPECFNLEPLSPSPCSRSACCYQRLSPLRTLWQGWGGFSVFPAATSGSRPANWRLLSHLLPGATFLLLPSLLLFSHSCVCLWETASSFL